MEIKFPSRRRFLAALLVLAGLALLIWATVALHYTSGFQAWLRTRLVASLAARIDGVVALEDLRADLARGLLRLRGLQIHDSAGNLVIAADDLQLRVTSYGLVGDVEIEALVVEGLRLHLTRDADRVLNVMKLFEKRERDERAKAKKDASALRIMHARIDDAEVTYEGISFRSVAGELALEHNPKGLHLHVAWSSAVLAGGPIIRLSGDALFGRSGRIEVTKCELRVGESLLAFHGSRLRPNLDVQIETLHIAAAELARYYPQARMPAGLRVGGSVSGTMADLLFDLNVDGGTAGRLESAGTVGIFGPPTYAFTIHAEDVDLAALTSRLPRTRLRIDGTIEGKRFRPERAAGTWTLDVSGEIGSRAAGSLHLPIEIREHALHVDGAALPEAGLAGVRGSWDGERLELAVDGRTYRGLSLELIDARGRLGHYFTLADAEPVLVLRWDETRGWLPREEADVDAAAGR